MKKRIFSMLLAVCMIMTLLPAEVTAEEWQALSDKLAAQTETSEETLPLDNDSVQAEVTAAEQETPSFPSPYAGEETVTHTLANGAQITVTNSGVITGGTPGSDGNIDIPAEIPLPVTEGVEPQYITVTSIGNTAFRDCKGLKSITIPDGVTDIGVDAF